MHRLFLRSLSLFFRPLFVALAAILVFEEWLWDRFQFQLSKIGSLPWVARVQDRLKSLSPWASLFVLLTPAVVLFPFKLLALWALANGHPGAGIGVIVASKIIGTALAAHLFDLVKESARKLVWFDRLYVVVTDTMGRIKFWLNQQPVMQMVKRWMVSVRDALKRIFSLSNPHRRSRMKRNFQAARKRVELRNLKNRF